MGMSPEDLMLKLKASKKIIQETENIRSVNGQVIVDKSSKINKNKRKVIEEDYDTSEFIDDDYMPEIPSKTANYQPKERSSTSSSATKLSEEQRIKNLERLPESIRMAMVQNPIPQVQGLSIFDDSLINEIAGSGKNNLIEEQEVITTKNIRPKSSKITPESFDYSKIVGIIEEVVDRKIKEYYDSKLMSENVQIRVGNTTFSGNLKPLPKK
jgi:hypothetical protein